MGQHREWTAQAVPGPGGPLEGSAPLYICSSALSALTCFVLAATSACACTAELVTASPSLTRRVLNCRRSTAVSGHIRCSDIVSRQAIWIASSMISKVETLHLEWTLHVISLMPYLMTGQPDDPAFTTQLLTSRCHWPAYGAFLTPAADVICEIAPCWAQGHVAPTWAH